MYSSQSDSIYLFAALFAIVWGILWLMVPFILISINGKLKETNHLLKQIADPKDPNAPPEPVKVGLFD